MQTTHRRTRISKPDKLSAATQKGIEGEKGLPPEATGRAIEEYLAVLDDAAFGAATDVVPTSDPYEDWDMEPT